MPFLDDAARRAVTRFAHRLVLLCLCLCVAAGAGPVKAQEGDPGSVGPPPLLVLDATPEQIIDLIATLEDDDARAVLISRLELLLDVRRQSAEEEPSPRRAGADLLSRLSEGTAQLREHAVEIGSELVALSAWDEWVDVQLADDVNRQHWEAILTAAFTVLAPGVGALILVRRLLRRPRRSLARWDPVSLSARLPPASLHLLLDLLPIAAFLTAAYIVFGAVDPSTVEARIVCLALINAVAAVALLMAISRTVLAPDRTSLRLLPVGDRFAIDLHRRFRRLAIVGVAGFVFAEAAGALGASQALHNGLMAIVGLLIAVILARLTIDYRRPVARIIRGRRRGPPGLRSARRQLAYVWHFLAVLYLGALYLIWALSIEGGFVFMSLATLWTIVILVAARWLTEGLYRASRRGVRLSDETKARYPKLQRRITLYVLIARRLATILIAVTAGLTILGAWGVPTVTWLGGPLGGALIEAALSIALVVVLGIAIWEATSLAVQRRLSDTDETGALVEQRARMRTLLPLLRNAVMVVVIVVVAMMVLSELGLNIAPLLAGAGVIGLAIGFGAQTLVQDVITGLFILFEDTISIGDVVSVGGHAGFVEGMTIRTVRLRDLSGNVHTIPFSQVSTVMNMTRDFSYYVFDIGIAYREDVDQVIEVIGQLGAELQEDPSYGVEILEPIEILGVDAFADSAVVIKARIMTKPIKQWMVGREFNRRMKRRFDELGIEIPFPHMTLYFGEDKQGKAPPGNLQVATPALTEALARALDRAPPQPEPRHPDKGEKRGRGFGTPDRAGDEPAESTPGHLD